MNYHVPTQNRRYFALGELLGLVVFERQMDLCLVSDMYERELAGVPTLNSSTSPSEQLKTDGLKMEDVHPLSDGIKPFLEGTAAVAKINN